MKNDFRIVNGVLRKYSGGERAVVPDGVKEIGRKAFLNNYDVKEIILPESVEYIGDEAFAGCSMLTEITLPRGLSEIGTSAFLHCRSLKYVTIPDTVKRIGHFAFWGCSELKRIDIPDGAMVFPDIFGNAYLYYMFPMEEIEYFYIPNIYLTDLDPKLKKAFSIYFLTSYEKHSEEEKQLYIPYIRKRKKNITEHIILYNVIPAMSGLMSLKLIPIEDIDSCIECANTNRQTDILAMLLDYKNKTFSTAEIEKEEQRRINKELNYNPNSAAELKKIWKVKKKNDGAYILEHYNGTAEDIVIPAVIGRTPVTEISIYAFRGNRKIKSAVIPNSITEITRWSFAVCHCLKEITISHGTVRINDYAFYECPVLEKIIIPESVSEIGGMAFSGCKNITFVCPEGSFAEQYAKSKHIRVVVSD